MQTVLLAIDSARDVYKYPRSSHWGTTWIDYFLLALFVIYTIEIIIRVIVSGFIINPVEYSTINRQIVVSFWISFIIGVFGVEEHNHAYVFRMLSCLRILRLLGLTSGTTVILRSLKRAAPLLVNVGFLIGFFWLLFAIIGVQSFKSSLRRTCVWIDPAGLQEDYVTEQYCGGYLSQNGTAMPYLGANRLPLADFHKGYLCPYPSQCIEGDNQFNGTVSYDNIFQSLELVFVIMTSNTFSDIMYNLSDSDYLAACLYFAFGIVIMALWLINLLIAVITSSFQVIRDESKTSAFTAQEV
ncbi:Ion transport [Neofusicoccum parvum]|nr:Ion transport [Neofusicoccum parvum]